MLLATIKQYFHRKSGHLRLPLWQQLSVCYETSGHFQPCLWHPEQFFFFFPYTYPNGFLYFNLSTGHWTIKKWKVSIYLWVCRNKLCQQLFWVLCCNYDDIHIDMGCWHGHHFSCRLKSCLFWTRILWEVPHIRVKALWVSLYSGSCDMWNHLISSSRGRSGGATGASAPVTLSLDPPVAPPTGSLHQ